MDACSLTQSQEKIIGSIALFSLEALFVIGTLCSIVKYVQYHKQLPTSKQPSKLMFYIGLIFLIISSCTIIIAMTRHISWFCITPKLSEILHTIYDVFNYLHIYFLLLVLFIRLYFVFTETSYKLSNITLIVFCTLFICLLSSMITKLSLSAGKNHDVNIATFGLTLWINTNIIIIHHVIIYL